MELVFDRQKLLQNLQAAMEQRKVKANELEAAIGVYSGYISRLKSEEAKLPGLDVIWKIAKVLKVNLMRLIEGTFERSTENLAYLEKFLQELFARTQSGALEWRPIHMSEINAVIMGKGSGRYNPFIHEDVFGAYGDFRDNPCQGTEFGGSGISCDQYRVKSFSVLGVDVWLKDACFYADFGRDKTIFVAQFCGEVDPWDAELEEVSKDLYVGSWYEFVVVNDGDEGDSGTLLCSTLGQSSQLKYDAQTLFEELKQHEWDYRVEQPVRELIDEFMKAKNPKMNGPNGQITFTEVDPDELPF